VHLLQEPLCNRREALIFIPDQIHFHFKPRRERPEYQSMYHEIDKEMKKEIRKYPCYTQTHKKFTFVRYADDWLVGVCGSKEDCIALKGKAGKAAETMSWKGWRKSFPPTVT